MSPEFMKKWEHILENVEKQHIPIQFIKKLIVRLIDKKQQTINVERLIEQGLNHEQVEDVINRRLHELDTNLVGVEFILNVQKIAAAVQPETDRILNKL